MALIWKGVTIERRASDGFVNATQMCRAGGVRFNDWYSTSKTKALVEALQSDTSHPVRCPVYTQRGGPTQGSWIHPQLATALACWINPKFQLKICEWIEEWKTIKNNQERYDQELQKLQPSRQKKQEHEIRNKLASTCNGKIEIKTPVGYIDVLSNKYIIEVKEISNWKHAVGQLLCYAQYYPDKIKRIQLFGEHCEEKETIIKICKNLGIVVSFEEATEEQVEQLEEKAPPVVRVSAAGNVLAEFDLSDYTAEEQRAFVEACVRDFVALRRARSLV